MGGSSTTTRGGASGQAGPAGILAPLRGAPSAAGGCDEPRAEAGRATFDRLVRCYHQCIRLESEGREFTCSRELGARVGCSSSLVRKDLSRIGKLGTRGHGYRISKLLEALDELLGRRRPRRAVLAGAGDLGTALLSYAGFEERGFRFVAVFDSDLSRVGSKRGDLMVRDVAEAPGLVPLLGAELGVLADIDEDEAQAVAGLLAASGVRAILNFAPATLPPGGGVAVANIDLVAELEKLAACFPARAGAPGDAAGRGTDADRARGRAGGPERRAGQAKEGAKGVPGGRRPALAGGAT